MANTLTNLIPDIYSALDVVSRELVGLVPSVLMDARDGRVAVNETVRVPITAAGTGIDISPAMTVPNPADQVVSSSPIVISKSRAYEFGFVGEEQLGLNNGPGYGTVQQNMVVGFWPVPALVRRRGPLASWLACCFP